MRKNAKLLLDYVKTNSQTELFRHLCRTARRRRGTPLFGLYGDVPLYRVCFFWPRCPEQGVQFDLPLSKTGLEPFLNRVWYYKPRDLNPEGEQSFSFPSLREVRLKEPAIERRTTSGAFLVLICIISTELN